MKLSLQLWTVRNDLEVSPKETLKKLFDLGIKEVECYDIDLLKKIKPMLDELGMTCNSCCFLWTYVTQRWDLNEDAAKKLSDEERTFDFLLKQVEGMGLKYLNCAYLFKEEREDYGRLCEQLNACGKQAKDVGITLCYHNHGFEFNPETGVVPYEVMIEQTDPESVSFELDVMWAKSAGLDPVAMMKKMGDRIAQIHIKDYSGVPSLWYDVETFDNDSFRALGSGVVDLAGVLAQAKDLEIENTHIEQDESHDVWSDLQASVNYINGLNL